MRKSIRHTIKRIASGYRYVLILMLVLHTLQVSAKKDPLPPYDEILVFLNVQGVGSIQLPAAIIGESAYLSVTDLFGFLKIRHIRLLTGLILYRVFLTPDAAFSINSKNNTIVYQNTLFDLDVKAIIFEGHNLYLRTDYFGKIFGLDCKFNFHNLSVILGTSHELPVMREMRLEAMRNNLMQLKGETKADTTISRDYSLFRTGMADWSVINTKDLSNGKLDTRINLALGGVSGRRVKQT